MSTKSGALYNFFRLGVKPEQPDYLQYKIILTNYLTVLISPLPIIFVIITYLFAPQTLPIFIFSCFVPIFVFFFNKFNQQKLSRVIMSILPSVIASASVAYVTQGDNQPPFGGVVNTFSYICFPFLLFDIRERFLLGISLFITASITLLLPTVLDWILDAKIDPSFFYSWINSLVCSVTSIFVIFSVFLVLIRANFKAENKSRQLVLEANDLKNQLVEQEEKLKNTIKHLERNQKESEMQTSTIEISNKVNTIIQHNSNNKNLYFILVKTVSEYLQVKNSGLFLKDEKGLITLSAEYTANDSYKIKNTSFMIGEGLVGQVLRSKQSILISKPITMTNETKDMFYGGQYLLVVPLKINKDVLGAFELYYKHKPTPMQVNIVENISENIAVMLHNLKRTTNQAI